MTGRTDLGGYDAMIFRFPSDTTVRFFNRGVPISLSIAWFDGAGVYLGQAKLGVCLLRCPSLAPVQPFRFAMEVPEGGLGSLGVGQGSVLLVGGSCA